MATVHVTLSRVDDTSSNGAAAQVITSIPTEVETLNSTATSQQGNKAASRADNLFWSVTAMGNVWVAFGTSPVAVSGSGHLILAGQTRDFAVTTTGEKIAIKDA